VAADLMMGPTAPRERAIEAVFRSGRIPGQNVTWSHFCDLVRAAAQIRETLENLPRGWSNAAIMNSAKKLGSIPATICERCKTEIALAIALDAEPDVDRWRHELLAAGERRVLSPTMWALFEALYAGRGHPVSGDFLVKAIHAAGLREHVRQLRRALVGSRYRIETRRRIGYELTIAQD
jgi:hypothetical protein